MLSKYLNTITLGDSLELLATLPDYHDASLARLENERAQLLLPL